MARLVRAGLLMGVEKRKALDQVIDQALDGFNEADKGQGDVSARKPGRGKRRNRPALAGGRPTIGMQSEIGKNDLGPSARFVSVEK